MEKYFTLQQIESAILESTKHLVEIKTPPYIDGDLDREVETIEVNMFLFRLFGSNINQFYEYQNSKV